LDPFWYKLGLSFLVGGLWITLTTVAAERFGSRVGGFLGGVPSTIVVALLFIGWSDGLAAARATTTTFPLAFSVNALYLIAYAALARYGAVAALGGAIGAWALGQGALLWLQSGPGPRPGFTLSLLAVAVAVVAGYFVLERGLKVRAQSGYTVRYTPGMIVGRGLLAGSIIALTVGLARVGGPVLGAAMGAFPAVFTSTLLIASRQAGAPFARGMTTSMLVSALINVVVYVAAFRFWSGHLGLVGSTLAGLAVSVLSIIATLRFVRRRVS
jgi:hypothetical protein